MTSSSKPFLILQLRPEDEISDSEFNAILKYGKLAVDETRRIRIEKAGIPPLSLDDYAAVIVGGSPFDITTPQEKKRPIQVKIEADFVSLFDELVSRDFPFLGACSGAGLLGTYLGTSLSGKYSEPVSCIEVSLTDAGRSDPLLEGFPDQFDALCGHKEACDHVPEGATLLVTGSHCPVQMFRIGSNVYATQFHPEGDGEGFSMRIHAYMHHGYFKPEQADALLEQVQSSDTRFAQEILCRFVARYKGAKSDR